MGGDFIVEELAGIPAAEQVVAITEALFEPSDIIELRRFNGDRGGGARCDWTLARDLSQWCGRMASENAEGENIFFGLNPRAGFGAKGDANVPLARCLALDIDPAQGGSDAEAVVERIAALGLPSPTVINGGTLTLEPDSGTMTLGMTSLTIGTGTMSLLYEAGGAYAGSLPGVAFTGNGTMTCDTSLSLPSVITSQGGAGTSVLVGDSYYWTGSH